MSNTDSSATEPTRREALKYGSAVAAGLGLAGCSDLAGQRGTETPGRGSYSVTMEPSGTRTFTEVPETYTVYHRGWADIMAALGHSDGLVAMSQVEDNSPAEYYNLLPGVEVDHSDVEDLLPGGTGTTDKELFYEIDPDINMIDPHVATEYLGLNETSVEELEENVAPFFGSYMRSSRFTDQHPYYSLYEGTRRAAKVLGEEERFAALEQFHDEFIEEIQSRIPPAEDRPSYAYMNVGVWSDSAVYGRKTNSPGYETKPFRDLDVREENNAFRDQFSEGEDTVETDFEGLLEADPEVIIFAGGPLYIGGNNIGGTSYTWEEDIVGALQNDPVASEVTAVKEDNILLGNYYEVGPVTNLFNTEDLAQQLYPDEFGDFRIENYPEGEGFFDRQRLGEIINGDF